MTSLKKRSSVSQSQRELSRCEAPRKKSAARAFPDHMRLLQPRKEARLRFWTRSVRLGVIVQVDTYAQAEDITLLILTYKAALTRHLLHLVLIVSHVHGSVATAAASAVLSVPVKPTKSLFLLRRTSLRSRGNFNDHHPPLQRAPQTFFPIDI